uniref:Protein kinase domain-containing protein n=1 Tax=Rhizochromulina marina TaxID=1034831 RepID=A0A7S2WU31_9STRA|mmetsp:Transcript_5364/g.15774  ORF Transcript_5364/g.15774 Transcript_5364/m.15774 type:complete len:354 (+) Transcript_5364:182-1243(+)
MSDEEELPDADHLTADGGDDSAQSHPTVSAAAAATLARLKTSVPTLGVSWADLGDIRPLRHGTGKTIFGAEFQGHNVVVKTPREGLTPQRIHSVTKELQHEAAILSTLARHEYIVQFYGFGTVPLPNNHIVYYLVVENLQQGTLSQRLGSESSKRPSGIKLPMAEVLAFLLQLAGAMHFLHVVAHEQYTIVHRDLKPDNIGFDAHGVLKVFDFGLSCIIPKAHLRDVDRPLSGQTGSARYMAPEVALSRLYNETVDVYSFGLVAWEIAHGKKPFLSLNMETHRRVVCEEGRRPDVDRGRPREFVSFLQECWHQDSEHRPSFERVITLIREMIDSLPPQQQPSFSVMRRYWGGY